MAVYPLTWASKRLELSLFFTWNTLPGDKRSFQGKAFQETPLGHHVESRSWMRNRRRARLPAVRSRSPSKILFPGFSLGTGSNPNSPWIPYQRQRVVIAQRDKSSRWILHLNTSGLKPKIRKETDRLAARLEAVLFYGSASMIETLSRVDRWTIGIQLQAPLQSKQQGPLLSKQHYPQFLAIQSEATFR
jgi:hypothetical protein